MNVSASDFKNGSLPVKSTAQQVVACKTTIILWLILKEIFFKQQCMTWQMPANKTRGNTCLSKRDTQPKAHIDTEMATCRAGAGCWTLHAVLRAMRVNLTDYNLFAVLECCLYITKQPSSMF